MINPSIHRYNKKNDIRHFGHIQHRIKIAGNSEECEPLLHLGETEIQLSTHGEAVCTYTRVMGPGLTML